MSVVEIDSIWRWRDDLLPLKRYRVVDVGERQGHPVVCIERNEDGRREWVNEPWLLLHMEVAPQSEGTK